MEVKQLALINDMFKSNLEKQIDDLHKHRKLRPLPKTGFKYRRDVYDRMTEKNQLNVNFFITNIDLINEKKSNLSSEVRGIIKSICDFVIQKTINEYNKLNDNKKD